MYETKAGKKGEKINKRNKKTKKEEIKRVKVAVALLLPSTEKKTKHTHRHTHKDDIEAGERYSSLCSAHQRNQVNFFT